MRFYAATAVALLAVLPALALPIEISGTEVDALLQDAGKDVEQYLPQFADPLLTTVDNLPAEVRGYGQEFYSSLKSLRAVMPRLKGKGAPKANVEKMETKFNDFVNFINRDLPEDERNWVPSNDFDYEADLKNVIGSLDQIEVKDVQAATPTFEEFREDLAELIQEEGLTPAVLEA